MSETTALEYATQHREQFLENLKELLRIPSISTLPEHAGDVSRAAEWLRERLAGIGFEAELVPGEGHPLVFAEWSGAEGKPTILVYGHYDVQPVDPIDLWQTPPFEPDVRDGNVYARGAADDKGQVMTFIDAAESIMRADGALPVNLKILLEGEEENGGYVIKQYVADHGDRLRADVAQVADSGMFAPGVPTIETGLRGIVYTEIEARGASQDLHSGLYGGVAPNPLNALAWIIAGLKRPDGRITIEGFYDEVTQPSDEVLQSWAQLPFDEQQMLREEIGSTSLAGEIEYTPLERTWSRPTLDVHGIVGGFVGEGAKTVIPAVATAKISMRLVPDQNAERIFALYERRVRELITPGITLDVRLVHGDDPVIVSENSPYIDAATRALEATFGWDAVLGRSGGSIPIVGIFRDKLGMNSVLMGWGLPDDNLHAPNEKLTLDNFFGGIEATIRFWYELGTMPAGRTG